MNDLSEEEREYEVWMKNKNRRRISTDIPAQWSTKMAIGVRLSHYVKGTAEEECEESDRHWLRKFMIIRSQLITPFTYMAVGFKEK